MPTPRTDGTKPFDLERALQEVEKHRLTASPALRGPMEKLGHQLAVGVLSESPADVDDEVVGRTLLATAAGLTSLVLDPDELMARAVVNVMAYAGAEIVNRSRGGRG